MSRAAALTRAFAAELLAREGALWCVVRSASMAPWLRPGDRVLAAPLGQSAPCPGDVLAVANVEYVLVHRLVRLTAAGLVLKGDALRCVDAPIDAASVLGRVVAVARGGRVHPLTTRRTRWLAAAVARYSCVLGAAPFRKAPDSVRRALGAPLHAAAGLAFARW